MKFDELKRALIGEWRGTKQLYLEPPPAPAVSSPSKMSVKPVAGGSFLQFDYDWTYEGALRAHHAPTAIAKRLAAGGAKASFARGS
jgi:hypothetical protein